MSKNVEKCFNWSVHSKYLKIVLIFLAEFARIVPSFFDQFYRDPVPICLARTGIGPYYTQFMAVSQLLINLMPVIVYLISYMCLFAEFRKIVHKHQLVNEQLIDIKKRLRDKV